MKRASYVDYSGQIAGRAWGGFDATLDVRGAFNRGWCHAALREKLRQSSGDFETPATFSGSVRFHYSLGRGRRMIRERYLVITLEPRP